MLKTIKAISLKNLNEFRMNGGDGAVTLCVQQIEDFLCHMGAVFPVAFLLEADLRLVVLTANV